MGWAALPAEPAVTVAAGPVAAETTAGGAVGGSSSVAARWPAAPACASSDAAAARVGDQPARCPLPIVGSVAAAVQWSLLPPSPPPPLLSPGPIGADAESSQPPIIDSPPLPPSKRRGNRCHFREGCPLRRTNSVHAWCSSAVLLTKQLATPMRHWPISIRPPSRLICSLALPC